MICHKILFESQPWPVSLKEAWLSPDIPAVHLHARGGPV